MTFKHINFDESPTMRSYAKIALSKGFVKPVEIEKTASVIKDLSATPNIVENIIKICVELRNNNMYKFAEELEGYLLLYKKANALYNVTGISGKDIIDFAHPKGGEKIDNLQGDAYVETILENQIKLLQMLRKTPTGKLANVDILRAVKTVLAQEIPENISDISDSDLKQWRNKGALMQLQLIPNILQKASVIINTQMNTTTLAYSFNSDFVAIKKNIDGLNLQYITVSNIDKILSYLKSMENSVKLFNWKDFGLLSGVTLPITGVRHVGDVKDIISGNWDQESRNNIMTFIRDAQLAANTARKNIRGENDHIIKDRLIKMQEQKQNHQNKINKLLITINNSFKELDDIQKTVKSDLSLTKQELNSINTWILETRKNLSVVKQKFLTEFLAKNMQDQSASFVEYWNLVYQAIKDIPTIKKDWMNA
jgi:hypothetical protein